MDYNKIYDDLRKIGIQIFITNLNVHSTSINGTTGNRFKQKIFFSITERIFKGQLTNINKIYKTYDIILKINNSIEMQKFIVNENKFNKLYPLLIHQISIAINDITNENNNE